MLLLYRKRASFDKNDMMNTQTKAQCFRINVESDRISSRIKIRHFCIEIRIFSFISSIEFCFFYLQFNEYSKIYFWIVTASIWQLEIISVCLHPFLQHR